jgi:hypothetical protein
MDKIIINKIQKNIVWSWSLLNHYINNLLANIYFLDKPRLKNKLLKLLPFILNDLENRKSKNKLELYLWKQFNKNNLWIDVFNKYYKH